MSLAAWYQTACDSNMICFRLIEGNRCGQWLQTERGLNMNATPTAYRRRRRSRVTRNVSPLSQEGKDIRNEFREKRFFAFYDMGYSALLLINADTLSLTNEAREKLLAAQSTSKAVKAFAEMTKSAKSSRVFAQTFIAQMAE
jgi:hypothetical protein